MPFNFQTEVKRRIRATFPHFHIRLLLFRPFFFFFLSRWTQDTKRLNLKYLSFGYKKSSRNVLQRPSRHGWKEGRNGMEFKSGKVVLVGRNHQNKRVFWFFLFADHQRWRSPCVRTRRPPCWRFYPEATKRIGKIFRDLTFCAIHRLTSRCHSTGRAGPLKKIQTKCSNQTCNMHKTTVWFVDIWLGIGVWKKLEKKRLAGRGRGWFNLLDELISITSTLQTAVSAVGGVRWGEEGWGGRLTRRLRRITQHLPSVSGWPTARRWNKRRVKKKEKKKCKSRDEITFVLQNDQYEEERQNKKTGGERRLRKVSAAPCSCRHLRADCEFAFVRKSWRTWQRHIWSFWFHYFLFGRKQTILSNQIQQCYLDWEH